MTLAHRARHLLGKITNNPHPCGKRKSDCLYVLRSIKKLTPNGARSFFLLIQTLPTFWATRFMILRNYNFPIIFWKPPTCGYVAAGPCFQKKCPHIFGSPQLVGTLPQALFFSRTKAPDFWKPLTCGYVAAGAFLPEKKGPRFLEAPNLWVNCRRRFFFQKKGPIFCQVPRGWEWVVN